ncbi:MAG TPA: phosphoribosylglycinamide formyltransferase [Rectinemataceae bacterium]|nr:phosphoribosylglycinamide formyltransferase [Rectinemataceae bacterium]
MAKLAVLASGKGSNFEALVLALRASSRAHECVLLLADRKDALALARAERLGIPARLVAYGGRPRREAEAELADAIRGSGADLVALAGFMRILGPDFVRLHRGRMVNVHPSLLPKWPGRDAIRRAYEAGETVFGVSVHYVDEGMDTGPVISCSSFTPERGSSLESIEARVHEIEHRLFPETLIGLLDRIERDGKAK